jgi:phospholipase/lecithinase/hemolysin
MIHRVGVFAIVAAYLAAVAMTPVCLAGPAKAEFPFSQLYVFGDSISDTGNVFLAFGGAAVGPP